MIYFRRGTAPRWFYLSIFGWQPFKWAKHNGWFMLSFAWFWRFTVGIRLERAKYRNRDAFYDYKVGPIYWRNQYRSPASKWYATIGRVCIRKWWVPAPQVEVNG